MKKILLFLQCILSFSVITAGFTGETLVKTSKDNFVKIKDLKADDKVLCFKPGYKNLAQQKINGIEKKQVNNIVKITIKDGDVIYTTPDHKFYLGKEKQWCIVENLSIGHELLQLDMKYSVIEKIEKVTKAADIFSMSINKWRNFGVTKNAILVHNEAVTLTLGTIAFGMGEGAALTVASPVAIGGFFLAVATEHFFPGTFGKIMGGLFHKESKNTPPPPSQDTSNNQQNQQIVNADFYLKTEQDVQLPPNPHPDFEKLKNIGNGGGGGSKNEDPRIGQLCQIMLTFPPSEPEVFDPENPLLKPINSPIIFNTGKKTGEDGTSVDPAPEPEKEGEKEGGKSSEEEGKKPAKTPEDLLEGNEEKETSGQTTQYKKPEDSRADPNKDFDDLQPTDVEDKGNGVRVGKLPDGRTVIVRPGSKGKNGVPGWPTLEIQWPNSNKKIKYRYPRNSFKFQSVVEVLNTCYKEMGFKNKGRIDIKLTLKKSLNDFNDNTATKLVLVNGKVVRLPGNNFFKREELENLNKRLLFSGFYNKNLQFNSIDNKIVWLPKEIVFYSAPLCQDHF